MEEERSCRASVWRSKKMCWVSFWLGPGATMFSGKQVIRRVEKGVGRANAECGGDLSCDAGQLSLECFQVPQNLKAALLCLKMLKPQLRQSSRRHSKKAVLTDAAKLGIAAPRSCGKLFSPVFNGLARIRRPQLGRRDPSPGDRFSEGAWQAPLGKNRSFGRATAQDPAHIPRLGADGRTGCRRC
jgi:hypothetical protein